MRRYELMLVLSPDTPDDRVSAIIDRTARQVSSTGGQIIRIAPWGRRRLAYEISRHREGSYHIILFDAPAETIAAIEADLRITEEVLRHLVTRRPDVERSRRGRDAGDADLEADLEAAPDVDEEPELEGEIIDESESEAAPAAID
ncbi:MAG TPA: 30S ribosomal protein S6 [Candidatus Limnocylindrales bacterium]|nr:30S ribosomal protein S6 [Candidatus Limnocylindrales bacterium]